MNTRKEILDKIVKNKQSIDEYNQELEKVEQEIQGIFEKMLENINFVVYNEYQNKKKQFKRNIKRAFIISLVIPCTLILFFKEYIVAYVIAGFSLLFMGKENKLLTLVDKYMQELNIENPLTNEEIQTRSENYQIQLLKKVKK